MDKPEPFFQSQRHFAAAFADLHLILLVLLLGMLVLAPNTMDDLLSEDGYVEIPMAGFGLAATMLALVAFRKASDRALRIKCIVFAIMFFVFVMEEQDWGIRLFKKENMVHGVNLNTLHELLEVAAKPEAGIAWKLAGVGFVLLVLAGLVVAVMSGGLRIRPLNRSVWDRAQRLWLLGAVLICIGQLRDHAITPEIGLPEGVYQTLQRTIPPDSPLAQELNLDRDEADADILGAQLGPKFPEELLELFGATMFFFSGWSLNIRATQLAAPAAPSPRQGIWAKVHWYLTTP